MEVETKVTLSLVETKLQSVDRALQTRGYIRSENFNLFLRPRHETTDSSYSFTDPKAILMILPVSKNGEINIQTGK